MQRSQLVAALLLASGILLPAACSEQVVPAADEPAAEDQPDAGPSTPTSPEDVPAVALEADPAVDCPGAFKSKAPKAGLNQRFEVAGQQREFVLLLPDDTSTPRPLFVAFNGTGEDGESFSERAALEDFAARGFVVLAPSSAGNGANWPVWDSLRQPGKENEPNKDLDFFDALVKCTAGHVPIDQNRIYAGGHSAGGIFTNHLLQRRSKLLAGGIPASGVFSLTSPDPVETLDPLFVIVTWGGDNDRYSGTAAGVSVGGFNFVTEASLASKFYDAQENVGEVNCRGNNLGHVWLSGLNDWFVDQLLAHPKGLAGKGSADLAPAVPSNAKAKCTDTPYEGPSTVEVECGESTRAGCTATCQLFGDCAVENGTVGPVLKPQLAGIGFSGANNENCGGCVSKCEEVATTEADAEVLSCLEDAQASAKCEQGINGAYPLIEAVNTCCKDKLGSEYCKAVCAEIAKNSSAATFFSSCYAFGQ